MNYELRSSTRRSDVFYRLVVFFDKRKESDSEGCLFFLTRKYYLIRQQNTRTTNQPTQNTPILLIINYKMK